MQAEEKTGKRCGRKSVQLSPIAYWPALGVDKAEQDTGALHGADCPGEAGWRDFRHKRCGGGGRARPGGGGGGGGFVGDQGGRIRRDDEWKMECGPGQGGKVSSSHKLQARQC